MAEKQKVWIDWGEGRRDEVQCYEFDTAAELNAFLEGVSAASCAWRIDDFNQYDTEEDLTEAEFIDDPVEEAEP